MESTNENYILSRYVIKVENKKRRVMGFIKIHKILIIMLCIFLGLIAIYGILLNQFIELLLSL